MAEPQLRIDEHGVGFCCGQCQYFRSAGGNYPDWCSAEDRVVDLLGPCLLWARKAARELQAIERLRKENGRLRKERDKLAALAAKQNGHWQPMDTAPHDGTEVLLRVAHRAGVPGCCLVGHWQAGGHCIEDHPPIGEGWYFWNGCFFDVAAKPVLWMPIPNAVADAENERKGER